jgi:hypothetical protein
MSLPPGLSTVTVSGRVTRPGQGTSPDPLVGRITFIPDASQVLATASGAIIMGTVTAEPDGAGNFQAVLLAPDATGISPTGWTYSVRIDFIGTTDPEVFHIVLSKNTPTVNLTTLIPAGPSLGNVTGSATISGDLHVSGDLSVGGTASIHALPHASSHAVGGSDPVTPASIGADPAGAGAAAQAYADTLVPNDWINVRKAPYNAAGDSITDDRAAIQAAINAAQARGGGTVYLPAGTYGLGATLNIPAGDGIQIVGSGWKSVLKIMYGANCYAITFPAADTRIAIRDLTIDGNCGSQTTASGGIYAAGAVACDFEHIHFIACRDSALYLGPQTGGAFGHNNRVARCLFDQSMNSTGAGRGIHMNSSDENQILGCDFEYLGGSGGTGSGTASMIYDQAGTQFISDCNFVNGANNVIGVRVQDAKSTKISGCNFDGLAGTAIFLAAQRCIVTGNTIFSPGHSGTAGQASGIHLEYGTADNIIADNVITSDAANGISRGAIREASDGAAGGNNISNNTIVTLGTWSYAALDLSGKGSQVVGNIGGGLPGNQGLFINPKTPAYKAVGDGVTDDTAAIQAAINDCPQGGTVYLPRGVYGTTAPLTVPPGVTLQMPRASLMVGAGLTNPPCAIKPLASFSGAAVIVLKDAATGGYGAVSAEQRLTDVQIDGSGYTATALDGIQAKGNVQNVAMRGVTVRYMSGNGIFTGVNAGAYPYSWRLYRVMSDNNQGHGFSFTLMTDITMFDCQAIGNVANGFNLVNLANSQLTNCRSEWNGNYGYLFTGSWGSGVSSGGMQMTGCSTDRNGFDGIRIDSTGTVPYVFSGLMLRRDGRNGGAGGGGYAAFATYGATTPVVVSGLTVFPGVDDGGAGTNSPQYGVNVQSVTSLFSLNNAYVQAATTAVRDDGTNGAVLIGPDVFTATGTTAAPVVAATAPWNWLGTAIARHTAAASNILEGRVAGENFSRAVMRADGMIVLGNGTGAPDTTGFYRESAGNLKTDAFLVMNGSGQSNGTFTVWGADKKALKAGSPGAGVSVAEGANARLGVATLVAGTVTVSNTSVAANTRIFLSRATAGGTLGQLSYTVNAGVGFTINASTAETSTVNWMLVEPA